MLGPLDTPTLPRGIRSRFVSDINGLTVHVLEAGFEDKERPCLLLLHGFPELAYSWRKVMLPLAAAGFHVVAPDQRGYGRTTGWDADYDGDLGSFRVVNLVRDALGLVSALGYRSVAAVIGHDFGSPVAAWCALVRPDVFRSVALMSAPFAGAPQIPFDTDARGGAPAAASGRSIHDELARLDPPRKHYHWYYSTREADANMREAPQGLHAFLRAYYHHKSADWKGNTPHPLKAWTATQLAKLPTYYIMELDKGMAESVAPFMPSASEIAACRWLTEDELGVYSGEYGRTGFQGGLQWYRMPHERPVRGGAGGVLGPHHRRARNLHRGQERLGRLPDAGRTREDADERVHALGRHPPRRRGGTLGAAGAARGHHQAADRVSAGGRSAARIGASGLRGDAALDQRGDVGRRKPMLAQDLGRVLARNRSGAAWRALHERGAGSDVGDGDRPG